MLSLIILLMVISAVLFCNSKKVCTSANCILVNILQRKEICNVNNADREYNEEFGNSLFVIKVELALLLDPHSFLSLSLVSKSTFNTINETFLFTLPHFYSPFRVYEPRKIANVQLLHFPLPCYVTSVSFSNSFQSSLCLSLPLPAARVTFGQLFAQLNLLPPNLTNLTFGDYFNQHVTSLPNSLTHITFGRMFNLPVHSAPFACFGDPVSNLPQSLTHLTFGYMFNQPVDSLPVTLKHLTFGECFNFPVDSLPPAITHLTFGYNFNQPVNSLPPLLTHLTFGSKFNQEVDSLPRLLTYLAIGDTCSYFDRSISCLPLSLLHLKLSFHFLQFKILASHFPPNLTHLELHPSYNSEYCVQTQIDHIPPLPLSLKHLLVFEKWKIRRIPANCKVE